MEIATTLPLGQGFAMTKAVRRTSLHTLQMVEIP